MKKTQSSHSFLLLFITTTFFFTSSMAASSPKKTPLTPCKKLDLYFHDILYDGHNAANATSVIVASPAAGSSSSGTRTSLSPNFHFGDMIIFDDPVTLDKNIRSKPVGRAQGSYIFDAKSTYSVWLGFAFVLNSTDYKGSITFAGAEPVTLKTRDVPVVGGTGDFFMHRGIATTTDEVVDGHLCVGVHVKFYECY
ncbi:unnamed protein product [Linum tenue]|uniref:Dirigent protein n=1 Tax=Linum tenue TaxID=586396 RepID=A0AAV0M484_9ROSI|nr:unnamed protein product [Linum tenue]